MTHLSDMYGLQVSADEAAMTHWLRGVDMALTFDESGIQSLSEAVHIDPDFALAHATLGQQQIIHGFGKQGREHLLRAEALGSTLTERETSQISVLAAMARFDNRVLTKALEHLALWPTDIYVFAQVVGPFGLLAFSGDRNWRQANVDLLLRYAKYWPEDDWWYLTTLGFMQSDAGDFVSARGNAEKAWQLRPSGNCAHALSHVHIEQGALNEGQAFIEQWLNGTGRNSDLRHHLCWHAFIIETLSGKASTEKMCALYREELDAKVSDPMPLSTFSDNASFLWRGRLSGFEAPAGAIEDTLAYMEYRFAHSGFVFADIHRIMIVALSDSEERKRKLRNELLEIKNGQTDPNSASHALLGMMDGFVAFSAGDYKHSAAELAKVVDASVLLGGSNPQRHVVMETFLEARFRAGLDPHELS